jgi:oligopeptide transport system substrate-binding protein
VKSWIQLAWLGWMALAAALAGCNGSTPDAVPGTTTGTTGASGTTAPAGVSEGTQDSGTSSSAGSASGLKVIRMPMRTDGPKSMDPVRGSTAYDNQAASQVYETLVQYKYLVRPPTLEPLLLEEMPTVSDDGRTYRFKLKEGVRFHDDPCFSDGKGRAVTSEDVFYSWKRMADDDNLPKSWWLLENTVVGLDEYREQQNAADTFDYDAPVEGLRVINDREFEVVLKEPVQRFMYVLAMFQLSVVPREAAEMYGDQFGRHPVGTGPFTMAEQDWSPGESMVLQRNPTYHDCYYPTEHMPDDEEAGRDKPAGQKLPLVDRVEITMFVQDQPKWLQFRSRKIDWLQVPAENFEEAFNKRTRKLKPSFAREGITAHPLPLLDLIFIGFNMEDELLGGYSDEKKWLRQALCLALDWDERNNSFYNNINIVYDGPIPPGLDGYPENGRAPVSYRGPNLEKARELLAKAGYPNGDGLPAIDFYTSVGGNNQEQSEMTTRQLEALGVKLNVHLVDFSTLIEAVNNKKAPFFSFAWGSDYPDGENNLALFYSPNVSPGANHFNYSRLEYDKLYEQIRVMPPSPERTELYVKMRDMIIEDAPFAGSMARTRFYLVNPRLKNFKPEETFYNWVKYLDVDDSQ